MRLVVGEDSAAWIAARTNLADEDQAAWVRMQCFVYELIDDVRAVELRGIDVIDPALHRLAQNTDGHPAIPGRSEHVRAGEAHGAETDRRHRERSEAAPLDDILHRAP
jgi:hypothetical protein